MGYCDNGYGYGGGQHEQRRGRFPEGRYRAKANTWDFGEASTGRVQFAVAFDLLDEQWAGESITWYGYFGDELKGNAQKTPTQITVEALRAMGWKGHDLFELAGGGGQLGDEVSLVIEDDEYNGKVTSKVRFVNKPGGLALQSRMAPDAVKAFAAQMRGSIAAIDAQAGNGTQQQRAPQQQGQRTNGPASTQQARGQQQRRSGAPTGQRQQHEPPQPHDRVPGSDDDIPF